MTTARFIVPWDAPGDPVAFDRHDRETHIPLAKKRHGLRRNTLSPGAAAVRGGTRDYLVAELDFDDMSSLQEAFQSPAGRKTAADVAHLARWSEIRSVTFELEDV